MNLKQAIVTLTLAMLASVVLAQSGEDNDSITSYSISEVSVTAPRMVNKDLLPAQTLSGEQLEQLSVHSVADAIRYFSGVQIKDFGGVGGLKTVNIRSMGTNHVGVFYDGIELGNAQNGQIDLGRFSLDNLEAITLYNGQRSAIFQSAKDFGSAGTIYLQSRVPTFKGAKRYNLRATFKTGSFDVANPSFSWEQKINDRLSSSLSAEYLYTSGRYKYRYTTVGGYDTTAVRENGDVNAIRAEGGLFGRMDKGEWRSKAYFYKSERGLPGSVVRNKLTHEDRQWDTNFFVQSSLRTHVTAGWSIMANAKYAYDYLHYLSDPDRDVSTMWVDNHYWQHEMYMSLANLYEFDKHWSASLSVDYQWNKLDADLYKFAYPRRNTTLVSAAVAAEYPRFKAQASLLATFVSDRVSTDTTAMDARNEWTPTVVASWRPFKRPQFLLRGFYKKIFRMPTLNDLYYTFIGNIRLRPEYTDQYDIGATYTVTPKYKWLQRLEVQVDAYYNKVKDKIVAVPTQNQFRWTMLNLGTVDIKGVDVALQSSFMLPADVRLDGRVNYTWQKAQDFTDKSDAYYGDQIPYIPWHSGSLVINAGWRWLELNYSFIYTGERYDASTNIPENYVPEWYTSDLALTCRFDIRKVGLEITGEFNNIFNQQFEVVKCYPMPGTNYKLILKLTI